MSAVYCKRTSFFASLSAPRARIPPEDFFRLTASERYSAFDTDGLPTHDAVGEPVSKGMTKKLRKELEKQRELFNAANAMTETAILPMLRTASEFKEG